MEVATRDWSLADSGYLGHGWYLFCIQTVDQAICDEREGGPWIDEGSSLLLASTDFDGGRAGHEEVGRCSIGVDAGDSRRDLAGSWRVGAFGLVRRSVSPVDISMK